MESPLRLSALPMAFFTFQKNQGLPKALISFVMIESV